MIKNQHQLKFARRELLGLQSKLAEARHGSSAEQDRLEASVSLLKDDIRRYELLAGSGNTIGEVGDLDSLPELLIGARVARGMTQKDLAEFIGVKMQQIQYYEVTRYQTASIGRIGRIADALGLELAQLGHLTGERIMSAVDLADAAAFPLSEMSRRGWFDDVPPDSTTPATDWRPILQRFFEGSWATRADGRRYARVVGPPHVPALSAWEARACRLAELQAAGMKSGFRNPDSDWLRSLVGLSRTPNQLAELRPRLREIGVVLLALPPLPGVRADAAVIRLNGGGIAVAMTLRDAREEIFWPLLMRCLAYAGRQVDTGFWDAVHIEQGAAAALDWEEEADLIAREWLIPASLWKTCTSVASPREQSIKQDARRLGVSPRFIVARMLESLDEEQMPLWRLRRMDVPRTVFGL